MPEPVKPVSLADEDPYGRLDVAAARAARRLVGHMERNLGGVELWKKGLGEIVEAGIRDYVEPLSPVDVARRLGILPAKPRLRGPRR